MPPTKGGGTTTAEDIKSLPKRIRFYHSKIDEKALKSGEKYGRIKNVIIIMILPNDPLGADRKMYTLRQQCVEDPTIPYDDGAMTIIFNTKGTVGTISSDLEALLKYIEDTNPQNVVNKKLEQLQEMVDDVKKDSEVSIAYMSMLEEYERMKAEAGREGEERGEQKFANLVSWLLEQSRIEDVEKISNDRDYYQEILKEYQSCHNK